MSASPRVPPARPTARIARYWVPVVVWMALILALSSRSEYTVRTNPTTGEAVRPSYALSKTAHLVEYGVLALLLLRAATATGGGLALPPTRAATWVVVAATAFGLGDELRQSFVPNREPRLSDVGIDGLSALAAVGLALAWRRVRPAPRAEHRAGDFGPTG